jgi:hypothetical protein
MATVANIQASIFSVTIDGTDAAYHATIGVGEMLDLADITTGRTGTDIVAQLVQGRNPVIVFEFMETTLAQMRAWLGMGATDLDAPVVGAVMPTHAVQLHPIGNATDVDDMHFYALSFGKLSEKTDGKGARIVTVSATCQIDASGKAWRFGTPA